MMVEKELAGIKVILEDYNKYLETISILNIENLEK
jgi:hypothetical protein